MAVNPAVLAIWKQHFKENPPDADLQNFLDYAVEIAKEEFGLKLRGTTPPFRPLTEEEKNMANSTKPARTA